MSTWEDKPIGECTDEEIVSELARRFDLGLVVIGARERRGPAGNGEEERAMWYRNGYAASVGLASVAHERLRTGKVEDR